MLVPMLVRGECIVGPLAPVTNRFQPPLSGALRLDCRPAVVPQSAQAISTFMPARFISSAATSAICPIQAISCVEGKTSVSPL